MKEDLHNLSRGTRIKVISTDPPHIDEMEGMKLTIDHKITQEEALADGIDLSAIAPDETWYETTNEYAVSSKGIKVIKG